MKSNHETLLYILGGSLIGFIAINHLKSGAFAAKDDVKKLQKAQKDMMKMAKMDMAMMGPICTCADGTQVESIAIPGMAGQFSCPCMAGAVPVAQGVTAIPRGVTARGDKLQTVPNLTRAPIMVIPPGTPNTIQGLAVGASGTGQAFLGEEDEGFAEGDMDAQDIMNKAQMEIQMALMNAGQGDVADKVKMLQMNAMMQGKKMNKQQMMQMMQMMKMMRVRMAARNQTCTCPDGTKVRAAGGICNCGANQVAGAIGLNRQIAQIPQNIQPTVAAGIQRMPRMQRMMQPGQRQIIPMGGVSPSNTGQVCVLDPIDNTFKLSGTNVKCDPGGGLTPAASPAVMRGESTQPLPDKFSMVLPATLFAAEMTTNGMMALPLIAQDDEDLYEDYGNMSSAYPNWHSQDLVSQYDEDSQVLPFFLTEPESYKQMSFPIGNYPRR